MLTGNWSSPSFIRVGWRPLAVPPQVRHLGYMSVDLLNVFGTADDLRLSEFHTQRTQLRALFESPRDGTSRHIDRRALRLVKFPWTKIHDWVSGDSAHFCVRRVFTSTGTAFPSLRQASLKSEQIFRRRVTASGDMSAETPRLPCMASMGS